MRPSEQRPHRLVLMESPDLQWAGLGVRLQDLPAVQVIGEAAAGDLLALVERLRPDGVLVPAELGSELILAYARALKEEYPGTQPVVVGDSVEREVLVALVEMEFGSLVPWPEVTALRLPWILGIVLEAGLQWISPQMVRELGVQPERRRRARTEHLHLTDLERKVLNALAAGQKQRQITKELSISRSTLNRVVARLKEKLEAPTLSILIAKARELGFGQKEEGTGGGEL